jgi:hypothetical protein
MKKSKQSKSEALAQWAKDLYESFLRKGFTTDQAFQLLLVIVKREKVDKK